MAIKLKTMKLTTRGTGHAISIKKSWLETLVEGGSGDDILCVVEYDHRIPALVIKVANKDKILNVSSNPILPDDTDELVAEM